MTKPGRPPLSDEVRDRVLELRKSGMGYGAIAHKLGIGRTTVRRILGVTLREDSQDSEGLYSREGDG